jgi:squalene synthase HpnC
VEVAYAASGLFSPEALRNRAGGENFPVALRFLPGAVRRHLLAIYAYARLADNLGDEAPGNRLTLLDELEHDLDLLYRGCPRHPVLRALVPMVNELMLPRQPFAELIEANRQDQRVRRYCTFQQLLGYCRLSANPVGHLVLHVFGAASADNFRWSDAICTALQLIEHCQDVAEDLQQDRIYLPAQDLQAFRCSETDLHAASASPAVRRLVAFELHRASAMLDEGAPLLRALGGWAWVAVLGFVAGGAAAIDGCQRIGFDVLSRSPRTRRCDVVRRMGQLACRPRIEWRPEA